MRSASLTRSISTLYQTTPLDYKNTNKNLKFLHPFFLAKMDLEKLFFAVLGRKQAILDHKNIN